MSKNFRIPQMEPWFDQQETDAISEYMKSGAYLTEHLKTKDFEELISQSTQSKFSIVVNNGTISLWLMLMALDIGPGDEVLVPNYTMVATPNAVRAAGATPIFCDVEKSTLCIDFSEIIAKRTPRTKAIFLVSANGRYPSYGIQELISYCDEYNLFLLEDAAQGLGSYYPDGSHVGTQGLMGSFSFSVPKIITTGQGGAIITNRESLAKKIRELKDFGRARGGIDIHDSFGLNFKFTDLQAVIGIEQIKKLEYRVKRKKKIWLRYVDNLKDVDQVSFFSHNLTWTTPWFIDVLVKQRDKLIEHLQDAGISTRKMYPPLHAQKTFSLSGHFPVSEEVGKLGLWLPSSSQLLDDEIDYVTARIKDFYLEKS